ncbi:MAG: GxxExxY protein [Rhodospirillales bacterium]|nr:GxxExxY protein [Rhodospirillales bacterium]
MAGENDISRIVVDRAIKVHSALGPGLLESAYEACLAFELDRAGLGVKRQVVLPLLYESIQIEAGFRVDLLIEDKVVLEVKAVEKIHPVHLTQLLTYLRLGGYKLGFVLNFHCLRMKDGIKRVVSGLEG